MFGYARLIISIFRSIVFERLLFLRAYLFVYYYFLFSLPRKARGGDPSFRPPFLIGFHRDGGVVYDTFFFFFFFSKPYMHLLSAYFCLYKLARRGSLYLFLFVPFRWVRVLELCRIYQVHVDTYIYVLLASSIVFSWEDPNMHYTRERGARNGRPVCLSPGNPAGLFSVWRRSFLFADLLWPGNERRNKYRLRSI